jgi:uncharacterized membrane protein YjgN (DUF898 family)
MTVFEQSARSLGAQLHTGKPALFVGEPDEFWGLMIRGNALTALTFGIYRFWLITDVRRYLWSNTRIAGDSLEYTGRGVELLLGFLIAVAILAPLYGLLTGAALITPGLAPFASMTFLVVLGVLGQYAAYRARRYRLTRTAFRGVRFHQSGSAWLYALMSMGWGIVVIVTLGLGYPYAQASLNRYLMRNTHYGDVAGEFSASARSLFLKIGVLWLMWIGPPLVKLASTPMADWSIVRIEMMLAADTHTNVPMNGGVGQFVVFALLWIPFVGALLYPAFIAINLRWWLSGIHFGDIAFASSLSTRRVYGIYIVFILAILGFGFVLALLFGPGGRLVGHIMPPVETSQLSQILSIVGDAVGYVVSLLSFSTIHQVMVTQSLWRAAVDTLDISNFERVDQIRAVGRQSSQFGEGLADALHVGSF